jgi:hypothetical protein
VHIYGSGPKMLAKLKEALGPDCFISEDMVGQCRLTLSNPS